MSYEKLYAYMVGDDDVIELDYGEFMELNQYIRTALRRVSREQVRRGTIIETIKDGRMNRVFSCCGHDFTELTCWFMPDFCPSCGAPMTDEAVEMVMERLRVLTNDN